MAIAILLSLLVIVARDLSGRSRNIPTSWWFGAVLGIFGGFATMIGNAAGPILTLYLLSMDYPKTNLLERRVVLFYNQCH
ncbi:MAG: hypothetical protein HC896_13155 [Bacteroidales bacterium]|nr:hypothetical protein [Bacteroidales bacterium]